MAKVRAVLHDAPLPAPPLPANDPAPAAPPPSASSASADLSSPRGDVLRGLVRLRWIGFPLAVFAFSRVAIFTVTQWSLTLDPKTFRPVDPMVHPALEGLCRWDCGWFQRIAMDGYREQMWTNFFPLFPLAGKAVHAVTDLSWPISMVVAANVFSLFAWIVMYRLFWNIEGRETAQTALVFLAAWPFSFFQAAGYPESVMTLATAGSILLAMRRRHLSAGVLLGLGILARHLTIVGGLALLAEQLRQRGFHPKRFILHPAFLGLLAPFAVLGVYLGFQYVRFGDPLSFLHARSGGWGEQAWYGVRDYFRHTGFTPAIHTYLWLSLVPGLGAILLLTRRRWWTIAAFGSSLMFLLWGIGLMGLGRYTGSVWPAFLPLAAIAQRHPWLKLPTVLVFAALQGLYLILYAHSYEIN